MAKRSLLAVSWIAILVVGAVVAPAGVATATEEGEPNDDFASAQQISEGAVTGEIVDGESDFFRLEANATDVLDVRVTPDAGDAELRIYGPDRTELVSDGFVAEGDTGRLTIDLSESGTYYVEVAGDDRQTTTNYTLTVDRVTPAENDAYAPNDELETAASIGEGFTDAKIWGGESDFFRLEANATDALDVRVTPDAGDVELRIYGPDRTELVSDGFVAGGDTGRLTIALPEAGTYYVEVAGDDRQTTTNYTANVDRVTPAENDAFAPNGDFDSAATITATFTNAKVWGGEADYFRVGLNASEGLEVAVTPDSGDVELRVYGPDRTELAGDGFVPAGSTQELTVSATQTGTYYVEVAGDDRQTTTDYRLRSNRTGLLPDLGPPAVPGGAGPPTDPDGDGLYEDVNGDGGFDIIDVALFLDVFGSATVTDNAAAFDFDGSGSINIVDVAELLAET